MLDLAAGLVYLAPLRMFPFLPPEAIFPDFSLGFPLALPEIQRIPDLFAEDSPSGGNWVVKQQLFGTAVVSP